MKPVNLLSNLAVILLFRLYLLKVNIRAKESIIFFIRRLIYDCIFEKDTSSVVMFYPRSRDTPLETLRKVELADLEETAKMLEVTGFSTQISV